MADRRNVLLVVCGLEGGIGLLALPLGWLLGCQPLAKFEWSLDDFVVGLAATIPLIVFFVGAARSAFGPLQRIRNLIDTLLMPFLRPCTWADLVVIAAVAGLGEELMFRGVLQSSLADRLGTPAAICLASLIFGLLHAVTATYAVLATVIGAIFGAMFAATDNLLAPIVAHGVYDLFGLTYLRHMQGDGAASPISGPPDPDG